MAGTLVRLVFLSTPRSAADFKAAAESLAAELERSGSASAIEFGADNSHEPLAHGYTHALVASSASSMDNEASFSSPPFHDFTAKLAKMSSEAYLEVPFSRPLDAAESWDPVSEQYIRHLVLWRFDEDKTPDDAVTTAVNGYKMLPTALPGYFAHLETAKVLSTAKGTNTFSLNAATVALYSTYLNAEAQAGFVNDDRRKKFKAEYVEPYLSKGGCLVFDFVPGAC